jgi:hypothetical protein
MSFQWLALMMNLASVSMSADRGLFHYSRLATTTWVSLVDRRFMLRQQRNTPVNVVLQIPVFTILFPKHYVALLALFFCFRGCVWDYYLLPQNDFCVFEPAGFLDWCVIQHCT